jgi:hypothetical protein
VSRFRLKNTVDPFPGCLASFSLMLDKRQTHRHRDACHLPRHQLEISECRPQFLPVEELVRLAIYFRFCRHYSCVEEYTEDIAV